MKPDNIRNGRERSLKKMGFWKTSKGVIHKWRQEIFWCRVTLFQKKTPTECVTDLD